MLKRTHRFYAYLIACALSLALLYHTFPWSEARRFSIPAFTVPASESVSVDHGVLHDTAPSQQTNEQQVVPTDPDSSEKGFPKIIWYKLGPKGLDDVSRKWVDSCEKANPDHRVEFLNDTSADTYVATAFAHRPDIVSAFLALRVPILKADMLRYMLMYDKGGVYLDLDVTCRTIPIKDWIPDVHKEKASLVVGWEFDISDHPIIRQFATWTLLAKPGSAHMMQTVDDIVEAIESLSEQKKMPVENITMQDVGDVVDFSGPRRMTFSLYKSLGTMLSRTVDDSEIKDSIEPKMVGDVLVMPGRSFAASSNRYSPEQEEQLPPELVKHEYAGSWKNEHGGETP